jgi:hypothetical protein
MALRLVRILAMGALIGGGFYLLLIDTTDLPELYVLAGVALACALGMELSREQRFVEASVAPWWLLSLWRVLLTIPLDIGLLCFEALVQLGSLRKVRGVFRAVSFEAVDDSPPDSGRRALTEWLGSLAPNTIVVGVDPQRRLLLVHQLHRRGRPERIDPLGLG